jgi:hypothetical protein
MLNTNRKNRGLIINQNGGLNQAVDKQNILLKAIHHRGKKQLTTHLKPARFTGEEHR